MFLEKSLRMIWSLWSLLWIGLWTVIIALAVLTGSALGRDSAAARRMAKFWAKGFLWGVGCRIKTQGTQNLNPELSCVYAANHSSALDIPVLLSILPENCRWIAKKELFSIPLFGPAMRRAGYMPIDRSNRKSAFLSIENAVDNLRQGASVVIFPEGTRSPDGRLGEFKSGGFVLALRSHRPVMPLAILDASQALPSHELLLKPGLIEVRVGEPLAAAGQSAQEKDTLVQATRARILALGQGRLEAHSTGKE